MSFPEPYKSNGHPAGPPTGHAAGMGMMRHEDPMFGPAEEPPVVTLVRVLKKRWLWFVLVAGAIFGAAVWFTDYQTPVYRATSSLVIQDTKQTGMGAISSGDQLSRLDSMLGGGQSRSVQTQIEILRSRSLQRSVQQTVDTRLGIRSKSPSKIRVNSIRDTDVIKITVDDPNKQRAEQVAAELMSQYVQRNSSQARRNVKNARAFVEKHRAKIRTELASAELELKRYQDTTGTAFLDLQATEKLKHLAALEQNRQKLIGDLEGAQAQRKVVEEQLAKVEPRVLAATRVTDNPRVNELQTLITKIQNEKVDLLKEYTPESPEVQAKDAQLTDLRNQLNGEASRIVAQEEEALNPVHQEVEKEYARALASEAALTPQLGVIAPAITQLKAEIKTYPERSLNIARLSRKLAELGKVAAQLDTKYHDFRISEEMTPANAMIVDPAELEKKPVVPNIPANLAFGAAAGLALGLATVFLMDQLDRTVRTSEDAEQFLRLPVLGTVPKVRGLGRSGSTNLSREVPAAESFRMVRTSLQFASVGKPLRRIVITSATPGEGKSTTAAYLAGSMAQKGMKVILIDADLRRPSLHTKLKLPNGPGLSSAIVGGGNPLEFLQSSPVPNLRVLTAGPIPPNPAELLDSDAARRVLEQLSEDADMLILDCPPCAGLADAPLLARACDGALFIVKSGGPDRDVVLRAMNVMRESGSRLFGVVLTHAGSLKNSYYYGYGNKKNAKAVELEPVTAAKNDREL